MIIKEYTAKLKQKYIGKYRKGYPLISKEAILNQNIFDTIEEGSIINLLDQNNRFIAKGYYGKQNKGYGWVLCQEEKKAIDADFFTEKIKSAIEYRIKLFESKDTNAFRVFNGEGDGIGGITIDYFDGYYLINWYSKGIYEYQTIVMDVLKSLLKYKAIYQKKRFDTKGQYIEEDGFVDGTRGEFPIIVKENGVNFAVYLNEGAMVGVFLDQREVRQAIREKYTKGKEVLNTFSYTGAFSVYAALGGAKKTTSVDLANRSRSKTIEQFSINDIDYDAQDIIVEDVFNYFKYAVKKQLKFDVVILDPPSFAKSKKTRFSAAKDYKDLLKEAIAITNENGVIVASTNCGTFDMSKFMKFIELAFKEMQCRYEVLECYSLPYDFKTIKSFQEGNYLKVVFIKKYK